MSVNVSRKEYNANSVYTRCIQHYANANFSRCMRKN